MDNNTLTALVLAALDDSAIKALNERINELAELGFKPQIVTELPEEGNDHTLYLVLESEPGEDPWYQEYLWLDNEWEKIGTTSIDFEDYYTKDEANATFVVLEAQDGGTPTRLSNGGGMVEGNASRDEYNTTAQIYPEHMLVNSYNTENTNWAYTDVTADEGVDLSAGTDNKTNQILIGMDDINISSDDGEGNETTIVINGEDGTIVLDASNGVQVPEPVNDTDASTKGYVDTEISNLEQEISGDLSDLEQALDDEVSAREQAIQDEADARAQAIQDEADARADDVAALQQSIDDLSGDLDDDIQELEDLIDTKADKDRFFDGRSEDWDEKTTEQKQDIWLGMVEDYVQLDIAETYDINSVLGLDPQETIVSDLYEDEAIDLTNQIIGGSF